MECNLNVSNQRRADNSDSWKRLEVQGRRKIEKRRREQAKIRKGGLDIVLILIAQPPTLFNKVRDREREIE